MTIFIESPNRYEGRNRHVRVGVIHTMETSESGSIAESVATNWFGKASSKASAHKCVDPNSVVECVKPEDTAWAAPGANADGYQYELAGRAAQNAEGWADAESQAILQLTAADILATPVVARLPRRWLTDAELADGITEGWTTHATVSRVFKRSTHSDPGPWFPASQLMNLLGGGAYALPGPSPVPEPTGLLRVDGKLGPATIRELQISLNSTGGRPQLNPDGWFKWIRAMKPDFGVNTTHALQGRLSYHKVVAGQPPIGIDGKIGPQTYKALQWVLGVSQDGNIGPATVRALQSRLNAGEF